MSGYMFGKVCLLFFLLAVLSIQLYSQGIYFADRVQKSSPFCHASEDNPYALLLLADVVVGDPLELKKPEFVEKLPPGKNSALALAKTIPDPAKVLSLFLPFLLSSPLLISLKEEYVEDKVAVPLGPGVPSAHKDVFLEEQEYIIYQRQVRIKYLVKVKQVYGGRK